MKQNFKIGKIFLFIIVSVCVFFDCEMSFCGDRFKTPDVLRGSDTDSSSVISFLPNEGDESTEYEDTQDSESDQKTEVLISKQEAEQQDQKNVEDNDGNQQSKQVDLDQEKEIDTSKQEVEQQDQESVEDDDQRSEQVKVVATIKNVYSPIDISGSIFDSTVVAM